MWLNEEGTRETKQYIELNENDNAMYQNLKDIAKAVLRPNYITLNVCITKERVLNQSYKFTYQEAKKKWVK